VNGIQDRGVAFRSLGEHIDTTTATGELISICSRRWRSSSVA